MMMYHFKQTNIMKNLVEFIQRLIGNKKTEGIKRNTIKAFKRYNKQLKSGNIDTYQGSFKVDESAKKSVQIDQFSFGVQSAIGMLYTGIRKGVVNVSPIDFDQFKGMKKDQFKMGLEFDYSIERLKTFPYDVGVLTWKSNNTRFYKIGVQIVNQNK